MTNEQAKQLTYKPRCAYSKKDEKENAFNYCIGYRKFIDTAKTEREAVDWATEFATSSGFVPFDRHAKYKCGDRVYYNNRGKSIFLAIVGEDLSRGANLIMAHTDSPRIDLKQRPLYEDGGISYFKTHYYGGLKKYQWTALPLSLHGVVIDSKGTKHQIRLGEDDDEPVFYISDLMPHIGKDQYARTLSNGIEGEELNIINGSVPLSDDGEELVKLNVLSLLHEKYGICEKDLINAELSAVPCIKSREVGFDRGMIAAYGHDDRVCAYPAVTALIDSNTLARTAVAVFADKEEIGSEGVTGVRSAALKNFLSDLCNCCGANFSDFCENSFCLSADVGGAFDPTFASAYDPRNSAYINKGVCVTKYTGSRGKSGTSDASAELVARLTRLLDANDVVWQTGEYGKVDQGGAGTVASEIAMLNIDVIDFGVPLLSMHSPVELASKADIYETYLGCRAFFEKMGDGKCR